MYMCGICGYYDDIMCLLHTACIIYDVCMHVCIVGKISQECQDYVMNEIDKSLFYTRKFYMWIILYMYVHMYIKVARIRISVSTTE